MVRQTFSGLGQAGIICSIGWLAATWAGHYSPLAYWLCLGSLVAIMALAPVIRGVIDRNRARYLAAEKLLARAYAVLATLASYLRMLTLGGLRKFLEACGRDLYPRPPTARPCRSFPTDRHTLPHEILPGRLQRRRAPPCGPVMNRLGFIAARSVRACEI